MAHVFLKGLLVLGIIVGLGMGFHHCHHHRFHRMGHAHFEDHVADICARAALSAGSGQPSTSANSRWDGKDK